jgi:hypothetical protein
VETKVLDLGDFIPETYKLCFTINGHKYEFEYGEATVDEVLRLMFEDTEAKDIMERQRNVVVEFLVKHAAGKVNEKQLREDLATVPYMSGREGLDISTIYQTIRSRHAKKNSNGAA